MKYRIFGGILVLIVVGVLALLDEEKQHVQKPSSVSKPSTNEQSFKDLKIN